MTAEAVSTVKNPAKVAAGRAAMRARWGPPRTARLDGLHPAVRTAVLALIAAAEEAERDRGKTPEQAA
jgi:hypothetical protein